MLQGLQFLLLYHCHKLSVDKLYWGGVLPEIHSIIWGILPESAYKLVKRRGNFRITFLDRGLLLKRWVDIFVKGTDISHLYYAYTSTIPHTILHLHSTCVITLLTIEITVHNKDYYIFDITCNNMSYQYI